MTQGKTPVDRFMAKLKGNPLVASAVAVGTIVITLSTFTSSARNLFELVFKRQAPEDARLELSRRPFPYTPDAFVDSAERGDVSVVKLFLAAGMDPNASNREGNTALMYAARARAADKLYAADDEVNTTRPRYAEIITALLRAKADVNQRNRGDATALSWAASWGNIDTVRVLLNHGANTDAINGAFVAAGERGQTEILRLLRDKGADVQKVGAEALRGAAGSQRGRVTDTQRSQTVSFLLSLGIDVNAADKEAWNALLVAAERGYTAVVRILLDKGARIDVKCECTGYMSGGWTALMLALIQGHDEVVQLLLDRGADINVKSTEGRTALMEAAGRGRLATVRVLLDHGADINAKDTEGRTALLRAAGNVDAGTTVSVLLDKGAHVNVKDAKGETALMAAARSGHPDAVRALLRRGAAPNEKRHDGKTALALAQERRTADKNYEDLLANATEIHQLLKRAGAQ